MNGDADSLALQRFALLRPHLEDGVSLTVIARTTSVSLVTLRRWARSYHAEGMAGLQRKGRRDVGSRRSLDEQTTALVQGLALSVPRQSIANIHREVHALIERDGGKPPSYNTVRAIVKAIEPAMTTLAHHGAKAYADTFDLLHRREAEGPNAVWQADHTQLDIIVLDENQAPVRPWLTVVIDDFSRAIAACRLFVTAPSALQTALALRDAIWRKTDPAWPVCGIPECLYTDHGSDFTSRHIASVCADLKIRLIFSQPGRPRGRGRIERFFSTLNQRVLSALPGYLAPGGPKTEPTLSLPALDQLIRRFILEDYHHAPHGGTGMAPVMRWQQGGFLPQIPDSLEQLDGLLLRVARSRQVHRDGVRLHGLRYIDPALAVYVGEAVTVRYDPADMTEIRIYHDDHFLCRAISPELAGETITLNDIVQARRERQRDLRKTIKDRRSLVDALLGQRRQTLSAPTTPPAKPASQRSSHGLRKYANE
ncbi:MAG: DDE-type integrase/transposase/recombinase [Alphaproteobacteria bacterium GM202ARS2]|nr:DDE-type integrase/transposase/recombinase [Alphaproteobacteria bacterium GM202ARS2]